MAIKSHQQDWEDLAKLDPLYAVCTYPGKRGGQWQVDEFFESGQREVEGLIADFLVNVSNLRFGTALDFGCGVGRVTGALSKHWERAVGVDISQEMISLAKRYHAGNTRCDFLLNQKTDLSCFPDDTFDFVYSSQVLQHIPEESVIELYVREFIRVLKPGGYMAFHLPSRIPILMRVKLRRHLYHILAFLGVTSRFRYERMRLHPMKMMQVNKRRVIGWMSPGARLIEVRGDGTMGTKYLAQTLRMGERTTAPLSTA